jgi:hypothetical protein
MFGAENDLASMSTKKPAQKGYKINREKLWASAGSSKTVAGYQESLQFTRPVKCLQRRSLRLSYLFSRLCFTECDVIRDHWLLRKDEHRGIKQAKQH